MPIYEYQCQACGYATEEMQKVTDAPLTRCPKCGQETFHKKISAAGFQLKGSGWYATDYKAAPAPKTDAKATPEAKADTSTASKPTDEKKTS